MKRIFLKKGAKEQLDKAGINPWHQPIPYKEKFEKEFEEELYLYDNELSSLISGEFYPIILKKNLLEIVTRITIINF